MIAEEELSIGNRYAIKAIDLTYGYGNTILFDKLNLTVDIGKCVAIMGKSGSGKSTLLRIINGSLKPLRGEVRVLGTSINDRYKNGLRRKVAYIPQSLGLVDNATVLDNVMLARAADEPIRALLGLWKKEHIIEALDILKSLGIEDKAKSKVNRLSGGEKQRVAIARALIQGAKVILADEPVSNLDEDNARSILSIMKSLTGKGTTILVVMHNRQLAEEYMDEAYHLTNGILDKLW
jgi:ABC-type phosphate/phosphonate transport system ATPase subunit